MAIINPFRAIRPSKEYERIIPALPYDVYNRAEAKEVVDKAPHSFLAIDRPETQFGPEFDMYSKEAYEKASSMLREWLSEGSLIQDDKPCYYIYELIMDGRSQTGIVGCASIDDYCNNIIKKHENTRADKEQDRINHVDTCNAQTGPIFLAYRSNEIINGIVNSAMMNDPIYDFAKMKKDNYSFLIHRISYLANMCDYLRLDHFRAWDTYCIIPASDENAKRGEWIEGPRTDFFDELYRLYPNINIIAEDLGMLFESVHELRNYYNLPGMFICEFTIFDLNLLVYFIEVWI